MTLLKKYVDRDAAYLFRDSLLITAVCLLVYRANGATIGGGDTIPNSLLAFNLLENHTLVMDHFSNSYLYYGGPTPYFFVETPHGSLVSGFPTGVAILTFPFYLVFYPYLKLTHSFAPLNLTGAAFEPVRLFYEKQERWTGTVTNEG